jgi:hypothetical protein
MKPLRSVLADLADQLQGLRHLRMTLHFQSCDYRILDLTFVEPTTQKAGLRTQLAHGLQTLVWPDLLTQAEMHILATRELAIEQPFLFPELPTPLSELTQRLPGATVPSSTRGAWTSRAIPWQNAAAGGAAMTHTWPDGEPIHVTADRHDCPQRFVWQNGTHRVQAIHQRWQVDANWWREEGPVWRNYFVRHHRRGTTLCGLLQSP